MEIYERLMNGDMTLTGVQTSPSMSPPEPRNISQLENVSTITPFGDRRASQESGMLELDENYQSTSRGRLSSVMDSRIPEHRQRPLQVSPKKITIKRLSATLNIL
jgi:hypothetical protein